MADSDCSSSAGINEGYNSIVEKKRAEEKYRILFDNAKDAILIADIKSEKLIEVNKEAEKLLGRKREELIGLNRVEIHPKDKIGFYKNHFKEHSRKEEVVNDEAEIMKKDGTIVPVSISVSKIILDGKEVLQGIFRDISEQKKLEHEMSLSRSIYCSLVEDMPFLVCRFLADGTLTFVNKGYCDYFNSTKEKMEGKNFFSLIPESDKKTVREHFMSLNKSKQIVTYKHKVISPDGLIRWQQWTDRALFNDKGKAAEFQSIGIDITEQEEAQKKIIDSERKLRVALANSAKQNIRFSRLLKEKSIMQEKLNQYAKQLEFKVKHLEKGKIPLTNKEKLVFYSIARWPMLNDASLAEKIKLKRSTVTAIRNRLKAENWFKIINLPNFNALGCESFSLINMRFNTPIKERKALGITDELNKFSEFVMNIESDSSSIGCFISKQFSDIKKIEDNALLMKEGVLKEKVNILSFFYNINLWNINFSDYLRNLLNIKLNYQKEIIDTRKPSLSDLNNNEKRVLCALVEFPECSIFDLSKRLWLSKPTVSSIKKKLFERGFLNSLVIPALGHLSQCFPILLKFNFNPSLMLKVHSVLASELNKNSHAIFTAVGNKELFYIMLVKEYSECEVEAARFLEVFKKNNIPVQYESRILYNNNNTGIKLDLSTLTKKQVFPESF